MRRDSVTEILQSGKLHRQRQSELEKFRRHVAVMFTDIKGSTSYFEKHGDVAGMMMVHECNESLRQVVEQHGGAVKKTIGDAILAVFDDCEKAVLSAVAMQRLLIEFNAAKPADEHVLIRIGLNYGPGIVRSTDVFGDVVNVASRVESVARPEQIVISDTLHQQVASSPRLQFSFLGRYAFKGKEDARDLFEVVWNENAAARAVTVHATVALDAKAFPAPNFKLQHINKDGMVDSEYEFKGQQLSIGRTEGLVQFPLDSELMPLHARFSSSAGQIVVEDLTSGRGVFVGLTTVHMLRNADVIKIGSQTFRFHEESEALAAAAASATSVGELPAILHRPVAEFVFLGQQATSQGERYPLGEEEVYWGRTRGAYTFPTDAYLSRTHARVYQRGENFFIEDLGSRNGTFLMVRGKMPVPAGSRVLVGGQLFRLVS